MRFLMWLGIGFAMGLALCAYILPVSWFIVILCGAVILAAVCFAVGKWIDYFRIAAVSLVGLAFAVGWFSFYANAYLMPAMNVNQLTLDTSITATDYSYETDYGTAVDGFLELNGKPYLVRLYLDGTSKLEPGDIISGTVLLRYTAPKDGSKTSYFQSKGIFLQAYEEDTLQIAEAKETAVWYLPSKLAHKIDVILKGIFPADVYPFVKALLLGDASALDYATDSDLKISGIRHIIAVSGLHISVLYAFIRLITGKRRLLTALIGIPLMVLFAAVVGFTPSVSRACLMVGLMMIAELFQKEYDSLTSLSFACIIILLVNPLVVTASGFQMSVGCVSGILLFQPSLNSWILSKLSKDKKDKSKWKRWLSGSISVTLSAMIFTMPLSAAYFGMVSLVGILSNLLTLWVVTLLFDGVLLACILGSMIPLVGTLLGWILAWPARYVLAVVRILSRFPIAAVYTCNVYIVMWLIFTYIILMMFLIGKRKMPALTIVCLCFSLCFALAFSWFEPLRDECRITVFDVGNGQSILLQSEGKNYLVDCGGDSGEQTADRVIAHLYSQGIHKLDGIILTHTDYDHVGGLAYLLTRIDADMIFMADHNATSDLGITNTTVICVEQLTQISFADTSITIYPPVFYVSGNENSICVLFETANYGILITGDMDSSAEQILLQKYAFDRVDMLVAGHHGSKYSTSEQLLQTLQPDAVVISAGRNNRYGHPAPELLQRLQKFGCSVYRTDLNGTITIRR